MSSKMRRGCSLISLAALAMLLSCNGEPRVSKPSQEKQHRIDQLIESLASNDTHLRDEIEKERVSALSRGSRRESDKATEYSVAAAQLLVKEGIAAFPQLAAHADDELFAFVFRSGFTRRRTPYSVGWTCSSIVAHQVDVWHDCVDELYGSPQGQRWNQLGIGNKEFKQWMNDREGKSLRELQLEAAERGLEWIKAAEGKRFPHQSVETTEPIRIKGQKDVEKLIERLKAGATAIRTRSFFDRYGVDQGR